MRITFIPVAGSRKPIGNLKAVYEHARDWRAEDIRLSLSLLFGNSRREYMILKSTEIYPWIIQILWRFAKLNWLHLSVNGSV